MSLINKVNIQIPGKAGTACEPSKPEHILQTECTLSLTALPSAFPSPSPSGFNEITFTYFSIHNEPENQNSTALVSSHKLLQV
jgi:hypothetical protein